MESWVGTRVLYIRRAGHENEYSGFPIFCLFTDLSSLNLVYRYHHFLFFFPLFPLAIDRCGATSLALFSFNCILHYH